MDLKKYVARVENFPKEGIIFRDITPLMNDGKAYQYATEKIVEFAREHRVDLVVGPEARGFIFGCPVSYEVVSYAYDLEYGSNTLCMHKDSIKAGQRVLIVDDLLATGGTIEASIHLIEELGGVVAGIAFLIELEDLKGREKIKQYPILTLMKY